MLTSTTSDPHPLGILDWPLLATVRVAFGRVHCWNRGVTALLLLLVVVGINTAHTENTPLQPVGALEVVIAGDTAAVSVEDVASTYSQVM